LELKILKNTVIVGAQFGDEGKGKIADILAEHAHLIIRYQGGSNAGHTVVIGDKEYKFHLVPSGILHEGKTCFIGSGVVIHPESFEVEIKDLISQGISQERFKESLRISPLAHITMPYHTILDVMSENSLGNNKIGTTGKGVGPTYADKYRRLGIRVEDLFNPQGLLERLDVILPVRNSGLRLCNAGTSFEKKETLEMCKRYREFFEPYVCWDWQKMLEDAKKNKTILFEGAQGALLDVDYGTYPFVTSSNPVAGGAAVGGGMGPLVIDDVLGVLKAYITRVGEGGFLTELRDDMGARICEAGSEFGTTTGRQRRCGWFDAVIARYSVLVSGLSSVAITKLDVFDTFDEIKLCVAYQNKNTGDITKYYPTCVHTLSDFEPIYETFEGWKQDISGIRNYDDLPQKAKTYLKRIEELLGVPFKMISVGQKREQTIFI
jgi:adenylosuccinate synthase